MNKKVSQRPCDCYRIFMNIISLGLFSVIEDNTAKLQAGMAVEQRSSNQIEFELPVGGCLIQ